jgi:hypothetical protein
VDPQSTDNGYPTWKQGPGVAADATPLVGPLASPAASGGAGQGASGNPLTPAATGSTNLNPGGQWSIPDVDPGMGPLPRPKEPWNSGQDGDMPGMGGDKGPIGAPPAGLDTSSIADNRLASLWSVPGLSGGSEYYGVKPGHQTGSPDWDDNRNQRAPLPGVNGAGSGRAHGPVIPPLKPLPVYLPIEIWPPVEAPSSLWGDPQVPNAGSGGEKGGGDTHGKKKGKGKHPVLTPSATGGSSAGGSGFVGPKQTVDPSFVGPLSPGEQYANPSAPQPATGGPGLTSDVENQGTYEIPDPGTLVSNLMDKLRQYGNYVNPAYWAQKAIDSTPSGRRASQAQEQFTNNAKEWVGSHVFGKNWSGVKDWVHDNGDFLHALGNLTALAGAAYGARGLLAAGGTSATVSAGAGGGIGAMESAATADAAADGAAARGIPNNSISKLFEGGRVPTASELEEVGQERGWTRSQTTDGPIKYTDERGINRLTIKKGSARTPGSENPHVEVRSPQGERYDPVTGERKGSQKESRKPSPNYLGSVTNMTSMISYQEWPGFEDIYLEDSFVETIEFKRGTLAFRMDMVLCESHPSYIPPAADEQHCYNTCYIIFPNIINIEWKEMRIVPSRDPDGSIDFGSIDRLVAVADDQFEMEGDWGVITVNSDRPDIISVQNALIVLYGHK